MPSAEMPSADIRMRDVSARIADLSAEKRALLATRLKEGGGPRFFRIPPRPKGRPVPLSFAQERLWFMVQMDPAGPSYNEMTAFHMHGALDIDALRRSLDEILRRHESLRTAFIVQEGRPAQVIAPACDLVLSTIDLGDVPPASWQEQIEQIAQREVTRPFDLAAPPLIRPIVLRLAPHEHVLLLVAHHIAADAWSITVLARELSAIYPALSMGKPSPLAELPIQYADFAVWQRETLQRERLMEHLSYWKEELENAPHLLQLPLDRARPVTQGFRGRTVSFHLGREETNALQRLGRSDNATLFMVLAVAFHLLLSRYSGQHDICLGYPSVNRKGQGLEKLIGFFVNTLVLRTDLSGDPPFSAVLKQVRRRVVDAQAHEDLPFEQLVEELNPPRVPGCTPVFQVWCVLQNAAADTLQLPGLTVSKYALPGSTAKFDLSLIATETGDGLEVAFEYNTDLFDACTIERLAGHFRCLLEGIALEPDARLSKVPLLARAERHRVLIDWNATEAEYPKDQCLHELFEAQAEKTPEAVAVVYEDQALTYRDLNARANELAHHLRGLGVGPEVLVGICVERSLEMVVGLLGILKAGGAYVPIDPAYPQERIAYLLADARPRMVLVHGRTREVLPQGVLCVLDLDTDCGAMGRWGDQNPPGVATPQNLAYVIYTSGSTGRPKGVEVTHRNAVHSTSARGRYYPAPVSGFLLLSSVAFDSSVAGLFGTLCRGGRLVLPPEGTVLEPRRLCHLILSREISHVLAVPSLYEAVLEYMTPEQGRSLRTAIVAGEPCRKALVDWHRACLPQAELFNEYGPTETTVWSTVYRCAAECRERVPIGRPISNTRLYVLDERLEPVPIGVTGELYIGGAGITRGYRNQGALTAERFIPDPYGAEPGGRLYKTGDRVRYLANGDLEFLGRSDHQVKIRGYRIEPGEIEAALMRQPKIKEAVVVAREDIPGDMRLVGYVVGEEPAPTVEGLRAHLKEGLPEYMMPAAFVFLESLPLTPNGKVDRKALPAPEVGSQLAHRYVAPQTPTEEILAGIWAEVLGVERVGIYDTFFELGGHSLLATQVVARVLDVLDVDLPLTSLFESPTIASLAAVIAELKETKTLCNLAPLVRISREGEVPLSFAQQRLWFLAQLDETAPTYHVAGAVRLQGPLQLEVLERSVNEIVCRHEVLRTTFPSVEGRARQVVAPALMVSIPLLDLTHLPRERLDVEMRRALEEEAQRPFDLDHGPLLRLSLLSLDAEEHVLGVVMHHIIADGWSIGVLIREFVALYESFRAGRPSPLSEMPIQYADYAMWQRGWLQGEALERQLAYWKGRLDGAPAVLELPTDRPRPAVQSHRGAAYRFTVSHGITEQLKALSRQEGATLFMVLLAAFQVLLSRYSGQRDICVGTPIANRTRVELEGLIGFFVNTLVLRTDLSGNPPFTELMRRVREVCLGAQAHQDLPFERLVEELAPVRDMSYGPLFQVMFALQNAPEAVLEIQDLKITPIHVDVRSAKFALTLDITEKRDGLDASLIYSTDLFDELSIARLAGHYGVLLESILARPDSPLGDLGFLTEPERHQLLIEWNATEVDYPRDKCIHELFEAQVEKTPEAVAVVYEDQELTYRQLNARANQLAHYLRGLGVGPEVLVGICVERSLEMVVGLLGILKAGGAYVPIDPTYHQEHIAFMVEDAQPHVLLTKTGLLPVLPAQIDALCMDGNKAKIAQKSRDNLTNHTLRHNLAYIIYTSGSTGRPKGVAIEQCQLLNYLHAISQRLDLSARASFAIVSSFATDLGNTALFPSICLGGLLHVISQDRASDPEEFANYVDRHVIDCLKITPSHFNAILTSSSPQRIFPRERLVLGGEVTSQGLLDRFEASAPTCRILNHYGPTETTIGVITHQYGQCLPYGRGETLLLGKPIANTHIHLLDRYLNPVPVGIAGELHVGGTGLARGYLSHPDLTAERFVPNPFNNQPGERLYRTGDLARYKSDGNIEYLGRLDHQVKIRGFRIELGEVEAALVRHPQVREVVVVAQEDTPGDRRLVGYVVGEEPIPTGEELRVHLKEGLPEYMVPAAFVFLDALPLTPNGKVDRKALPVPDVGTQLAHQYVAPRSPTEESLAEIWAEVLGVERVGAHDNFFELGGDSILSIQVVSRARQAGMIITPKDLFQYQTVARLAAAAGGAAIAAEQGLMVGEIPLSPIQHWFFEQALPNPHHWNQSVLLEVREPLDAGALGRVVAQLDRHHDALRLRFVQEGARWRQHCVAEASPGVFQRVDLSMVFPEAQREAIVAEAAKWQASLHLSEGPLWRVIWFDLGKDRPSRLLLVIHHLAMDGVSWRTLLEDLQRGYRQALGGQPILLSPKTTSFKQWSERLQEYVASGALDEELDYWLPIASADLNPLPVDDPRGANLDRLTETVTVSLDAEATDALLRQVPAAYHTQINDVLLTALTQTLCEWIQTESVLIDLEGHGREELFDGVDLSRTVGWFTGIFPVLLVLPRFCSSGEAIKSIKEQLRGIPHKGMGYGLLQYLGTAELAARLKSQPSPQVTFNYLGQFGQSLPEGAPFALAKESAGPERHGPGARTHALDISGLIVAGRLELSWSYSTARYRRDTIEELACKYMSALESLIRHCLSPEAGGFTPSDFPLAGLDQSQLDTVLGRFGTEHAAST